MQVRFKDLGKISGGRDNPLTVSHMLKTKAN